MKPTLDVIKVGGQIVEEEDSLARLLDEFSAMEGRKVLVHGGGRSATKLAAQLGIETKMIDGRRVTDAEMLKVVTMVYGGLVNKNIVAKLQALGVNAIGLTGADGNVLLAHRRGVLKVQESKNSKVQETVDYGFVGDIDKGDGKILSTLIEQGIVPVMAPLTHDGKGSLLNTNADTIAAETAKALTPYYDVTLTYQFEKPGVMRDPDDDESVIPIITAADFERLKTEGIVSGGMIPKLQNAFDALEAGIARVFINKTEITVRG